jgi:hypothetical protein
VTRPRLRGDLRIRDIDGEAIVLDRKQDHMHSFNPTAACIVRAVDGEHTVEEISAAICAQFEVSADQSFKDTVRTLADLERLGLLEPTIAEPTAEEEQQEEES